MKLKLNTCLLVTIASLMFITFFSCNTDDKNLNLPKSPQSISPLIIGKKIPDMMLTDIYGNEVNLKKIISERPTILVFYRGIWCMYCNQQISQLREINQLLSEMGYQVIAVSSDKLSKNIEMMQKYELEFPILSDSTLSGAKSLGIAYDASEIYKGMFLVLEENSGTNHHILPVPAVFILNQEGTIIFEYINPDFKIRISPELLISAAKFAFEQ
ncbi:MAG: peroxiredoxin-like family protein [bacterium]